MHLYIKLEKKTKHRNEVLNLMFIENNAFRFVCKVPYLRMS